tara:strand:- start:38207 stop:39460 length:1254 start_codon:yes stop_codon:yes gene_type:complete
MIKLFSYLLTLLTFFILSSCGHEKNSATEQSSVLDQSKVTIGAEVFIEEHLGDFEGMRIGLVMNPTARIGEVHMLDTLLALNVNVTALFAPEHGFRGEAGAGEKIEDGIDQSSGLPVFSLYGDTRKPTPEMMENVDVLIFDMQDVGARFYTYIATLGYVIEAAAEAEVAVWILDRPNPAGGNYVNGWILEDQFKSFVGPYPIPIAHGLTLGELAHMMIGEEWIPLENDPELHVVEMRGWNRDMIWPDTGLNWVPPSPNLPTFEHAFLYLGTVYYEGTTLSEGRGTPNPFLTLGDPSTQLTDDDMMKLKNLTPSLQLERISFVPESIPGVAPNPKHLGSESFGVKINAVNYDFDPIRVGLEMFSIILNSTSDYQIRSFLYRLAGTQEIDRLIEGELSASEIDFEIEEFLEQRQPYLLY